MAAARFTIIIPCHNEAAVVERKLENCASFTLDEPVELLLVDDDSTDATLALAQRWLAAHGWSSNAPAHALSNRYRPGKNGALRTAIEEATGEILLVTDADIILDDDVLARVRTYFQRDPRLGALCLTPRIASNNPRTIRWYTQQYESFNRRLKMLQSRLDSVPMLHGQAMFLRASTGVRPHESLPGDDVDFAIQVRLGGWRVRYAADVPFYEQIAADSHRVFDQKIRRAKAVMRSLWYHRELLLNPRYGWFGLVCYPLDFFLYFLFAPLTVVAILGASWWLFGRYGAAGLGVAAVGAVILLLPLRRAALYLTLLTVSAAALLMEQRPRIRWTRG